MIALAETIISELQHKTRLSHHDLLKCLFQARKVSGHVFVC